VCDQTILGVDTVGKALDCLLVAVVHVGECVATDGASVDEVERRSCLPWWYCYWARARHHGLLARL
jgi:hypothetical protein